MLYACDVLGSKNLLWGGMKLRFAAFSEKVKFLYQANNLCRPCASMINGMRDRGAGRNDNPSCWAGVRANPILRSEVVKKALL